MAKKKQLAGKKTKLAKLPLTRVLAGQGEGAVPGDQTPAVTNAAGRVAYLPAAPEEGAAGWQAATYLYLLQELTSLRSQLLAPASLSSFSPQPAPPQFLPDPYRLSLALRQARNGLRELQQALLRPA